MDQIKDEIRYGLKKDNVCCSISIMCEQTSGITHPLVTVLMPVYNSPDVISSVHSVLEQDYDTIEFIVINDHSPHFSGANMRAYLEAHAGRNIQSWRVLENSQNLGTVKTLNKGITESRGEIIFNLAGDDLFTDKQVLSDWVHAFQETKAVVMTGIRENYDDKFLLCTGATPNRREINWLRHFTPCELFEQIAVDNFLSGCSTARKRDFFDEYGLYDEQYRLIEDFPAALRFLRQGGQIVFFERKVIKYRGGGISSMGRIGADYEKDLHLIYENEIIPYTKYPQRAKNWLRRWEQDIAFDRQYFELEQKYGQSQAMRLPLRAWYYMHHPRQAVKKILKR